MLEETKSRLAVARKDREVLAEQRKKEYRNAVILENWLIERQRMKVCDCGCGIRDCKWSM